MKKTSTTSEQEWLNCNKRLAVALEELREELRLDRNKYSSFPVDIQIEKIVSESVSERNGQQIEHTIITNSGGLLLLSCRQLKPDHFMAIYGIPDPSSKLLHQFRQQKQKVLDTFGIGMLPDSTDELLTFGEWLPCSRISASYLFKVIIKRIMFQDNLQKCLNAEAYWEASLDE